MSVRLFLATVPNDKNSRLTNFHSAACSSRLSINAAFRGLCSVTFRSNLSTDIENLAFTAGNHKQVPLLLPFFLAAVSGESQYAGNPATADAPAFLAISRCPTNLAAPCSSCLFLRKKNNLNLG